MIELHDLSKAYRTADVETTALNHVNLEIEAGEFIAIMGPSGCGKSTLLNIIGMLDSPDSGRYGFVGKDVAGCSESELAEIRKENIGFIFQSFNLVDELSVAENVGLPLLYQKINGQAELYLSAGFVSLESQWYEAVDDADSIIEVNLYHMGGLMNAFSVFSLQRRDTAQTIDVTPFAYQTDNTIYMVHGPYYVEILSTMPAV